MGSGRPRRGCLGGAAFALTLLLLTASTLVLQAGSWLTEQLTLVFGGRAPGYTWAAFSWANAALIWIFTLPLLALTRSDRLRAAYRAWSLAALLMIWFSIARLVPTTSVQLSSLIQIVAGAVAAAILLISRRRDSGLRRARSSRGTAVAIATSAIAIMPWAILGALGSPLDTLLHLFAGLTFGLVAALQLDRALLRPLASGEDRSGSDLALATAGSIVALGILAGGFGAGGSQLLLMAAIPPLGVGAVALAARQSTSGDAPAAWLPVAVLIGIPAAVAMASFDPDELTLLLGGDDIPGWATAAALLSTGSGIIASILVWIIMSRSPAGRFGPGRPLLPATVWGFAALAYLVVGQPGFHGEKLFVIMGQQADLSQANEMGNRQARLEYVYRTLVSHADATQANLRDDLNRFGIEYTPYYLVNGLEVDGGPLVRLYLSSRPDVDRVLESPRLRPLPQPLTPPVGEDRPPEGPTWNVVAIGANRVWSELGVTGRGIVVAVLDSGVQGDHPALSAKYRGRGTGDDRNWLDPWNLSQQPVDVSGHGTHTTGTVLAAGGLGVAPDAEWFACVNLARNLGNPARYLDCMQFALAPYPQTGDPFAGGDPGMAAHITNNSWGCPPIEGCDATALLPAVAALRAAGIFTVASAGNTGPDCESVTDPPAIYRQVLSIGAIDETGTVSSFSSRGPVSLDGDQWMKPDLVAPGEDILSTYPNSGYHRESGTSMAGPHVSGVVALMWSVQPRLIGDIDRTERILIETAQPYRDDGEGCVRGDAPNTAYGYGIVDAYAAVKAALALE